MLPSSAMTAADSIQPWILPEDNLFAEIIIPLYLPANYTWSVPPALQQQVQPGIRVEVSLRNKKYAGIVKRVFSEKPEAFSPRPILNVLDKEPLLYPQQLQLWQWIAQYYMCTEGDVMQAAVPANFKLTSESILIWNDLFDDEDLSYLSDEEYLVAEALGMKKELKLSEVQQILDASHVYPIIKKLIDKHICFVWEELKQKYTQKKETYIRLAPEYHSEENLEKLLNEWSRAPKQLELLLSYLHFAKTKGEVLQPELLKKSGATAAQLKGLIEKNILLAEKRAVDRLPLLPMHMEVRFDLSPAQQTAYEQIQEQLLEHQVCLLHGVTSSGKTEIYVRLIENLLASGKQILYMLPEIALTAQIINRLRKYFGSKIAIYHSKFNANERVEIWNKIKSGETQIVLGARSSLLLPFRNLGLIIVDEEHDASYKQHEPAPRYQARDTAIFYASLFDAKVLLGSATPSLESYHNCQQKKYGLVTLAERYGNVQMPQIEVIDMKAVPRKENEKIILSPVLQQAITTTLQAKKQVILFQNRRGYATYLQCSSCGWIPECQHCNVTLTLHKHKNKLSCHYCGTEYPVINTCPACGNHHFVQKNFGTEQIEENIAELFPTARVARMDLDSVRGKHDHETLIKIFEQSRIDILVGTQMVVKGLDFENVQMVGIVDADSILSFADFRVNERAFQLMEQVSGRAGRRDGKGFVYIQVNQTHHPVLQFVKEHNYAALYDFEIENRKNFFYPPFSRIIQVIVRHRDKTIAEEAASKLVQALSGNYFEYITGPSEPLINRIRNQYIFEIMLKLPKENFSLVKCKNFIALQSGIIQSQKRYRSVMFVPNVDPM